MGKQTATERTQKTCNCIKNDSEKTQKNMQLPKNRFREIAKNMQLPKNRFREIAANKHTNAAKQQGTTKDSNKQKERKCFGMWAGNQTRISEKFENHPTPKPFVGPPGRLVLGLDAGGCKAPGTYHKPKRKDATERQGRAKQTKASVQNTSDCRQTDRQTHRQTDRQTL